MIQIEVIVICLIQNLDPHQVLHSQGESLYVMIEMVHLTYRCGYSDQIILFWVHGGQGQKSQGLFFFFGGYGNGNLYKLLSLGKIVILFLIVITRHLDPAKTLHDFARNTFSMRIYNTYVWICLCEMIWHVWGNSNSISIFLVATLLCLFVDLKKPMIFFF